MSASAILLPGSNESHPELRAILGITFAVLIYGLYLPICAWSIYQYNVHKKCVFMKKRHMFLTFIILINLVLSLILLPVILLGYANVWDILGAAGQTSVNILLYTIIVLAINIGWKALWRLWTVYFDTKWAYSIKNAEWKVLINNDAHQSEDWFIANKACRCMHCLFLSLSSIVESLSLSS